MMRGRGRRGALRTGSWPLLKSQLQSQSQVASRSPSGSRSRSRNRSQRRRWSHSAIEPVASQQYPPYPSPSFPSPSVASSAPSTASLKSKGRIKRDSCYLSPAQHRQPRTDQARLEWSGGKSSSRPQSRHTHTVWMPRFLVCFSAFASIFVFVQVHALLDLSALWP